ncbi:putative cysteine-rich receptor-like protein kinase 31 isoform X2 [Prosopis cineraria]|uniref:putative cysteine-rich receptor-like protein kinase 31 isoform X2 n=1 Tax=Prosopis cineraria TaxID=364024 RepID=UPI002410A3F2|nr:putative cysteine-rich receptor-like protein kinase 31 isoform X2 [Prosopis cineraria]
MRIPNLVSIALIFVLFQNSFPRAAPQCALNLSSYPYVAYQECGRVQDQIDRWDGFPSTFCCRNALTVFAQALALRARSSPQQGSLFISHAEWVACTDAFRLRHGVSPTSCGFPDLYLGASKCSSLTLQDLQGQQFYQSTLDECAHFDHPSRDSCSNCVTAVLTIRDSLYNQFVGRQDLPVERAICGVAALVSVAAGKPDDPSIPDKFLRCWPPPPINDHPAGFLKSFSAGFLIALSAVIAMALMAILVGSLWQKKPRNAAALKEITMWSGMYWFSRAEIENAINYGNERKCLGRGSAGQVFKGVLPSGQVVAIKHLNKTNSSDSFTREVEGLSRLRHPNLVCLFGCCIEDGERYLVYEYCAEGNLAQHLLRRDSHLTWETRVRILRDCSFALKYLHHHVEGCVVHRDIKARDVSMGKRPTSDFEDPRLKGQVNVADFEAILHIAVLCVAKSSKGRPTIEVVFEELDKAYKNTLAQSKATQDRSGSGTSNSTSSDRFDYSLTQRH